jgi:lysophospholipase L1-like esterase
LVTPFELARIRQDTIDWYLSCYSPADNGTNLSELRQQMTAAAKRTDARVVLVIYPLLESLERQYPLQPVHDVLLKLAKESNLPAFDLAPTFVGQTTSTLWVDAADHHPNGATHQMAARAIVEWLQRDLPDFLTENQP